MRGLQKALRQDWVEIELLLLEPSSRLASVPDDTKKTPLTMRVAGFLDQEEAQIGSEATILTPIRRSWTGTLVEINPRPEHRFGPVVSELQGIGPALRAVLKGCDNDADC